MYRVSFDYLVILSILVGLLAGLVFADSIYDFPVYEDQDVLHLDNSSYKISTESEWIDLTAKVKGGRILDRGLVVDNESNEIEYWESKTFTMEEINEIKVYSSFNNSNNRRPEIELRSSYIPDFGDSSGLYSISNREKFVLNGGEDSFKVFRDLDGGYYRVSVSMSKNRYNKSPVIEEIKVS